MFTAVIPVRKGSRRLKNKNIAPFANSNLLQYKIEQLQQVQQITNILVSSDSDEMLKMAQESGAKIHKRAEEYCDEKTQPFGVVVAHICENAMGEHIVWATCTSPLVEPYHYTEAIKIYLNKLTEGYDSLMSVEQLKRYLWHESGPLNYELGIKHVPSQELPPLYRVTDGILIAPRLKMIEWKYFHGINPYKYVMDKRSSVDIDDIYDIECAKAWLNLE
ncbi:MAG: acylneuraminate cytidylyltransferase family protein [Limnospira sp. PMC 1291.21]|uniref:acylneuraminate cytidylyltransferase family protein n=1 Tax=unclassified Limnospira TaxID=2642885 RepID=UPI0028E15CF4|nr:MULTISPECIES: acylneuraminate cytidylyltransferase family protein [unclassified Limnospira]MDT9179475.1 acylneuraminate cytidylyltransferase family protein [Limnospira sp. PMC 1238.20]MDT9229424.1 acylneuraminate cytidylyltransferase family protein [Limnospira sp. PMC 1242.20]MDT9246969.1 acylneuraminate cytidylyltransferase family protein [Limnospira sp. PMC 1249.20]MDT9250733.1 acylneuraminate cytidylyltransferase family protein [Limnospira sp. PMC 1280.21]MDT9266485.1 acylneuraminate cyt